jgi:hypothetical protein
MYDRFERIGEEVVMAYLKTEERQKNGSQNSRFPVILNND